MQTINLESLRPKEATTWHELKAWIKAKNIKVLRVSELPEPMLLSITKELRQVELVMKGDTSVEPNAAVGIGLVLEHLMRPKQGRKRLEDLKLSDEAMANALTVLQIALEREIVARLVGVRPDDDHENYLKALDSCL